MRQTEKKPQRDAGKLPYGARRVWHCHSYAVDFLRKEGGPYGVELVLDSSNVKKLRSALKTCLGMAESAGKDKIQINAHWGRQRSGKGFKLDVKVHQPK